MPISAQLRLILIQRFCVATELFKIPLKSNRVLTVSHIVLFIHMKDSFDFFYVILYVLYIHTRLKKYDSMQNGAALCGSMKSS